jgi:hypothetical protein
VTSWFDIDRKGLAKLIERRGKIWLLHELIANAWDADDVKIVEIVLEPEEGVPLATVIVRDDAPDGFADLSHAWTLFAESSRKSQAQKRGRFNLGEKLVLALCNEASIVSTKGAVMFDNRGRTSMKTRRPRGTEFQGIARITRAELAEIRVGLRKLIAPPHVMTLVDGERLPTRVPLKTIEATLPTEIADDEGMLRRTARKTMINVYALLPGETAMLYEMGIPVVETGDKWHVDVQQKVPLNMDRDNVTPAYLRDVRTLVVNAMHDQIGEADANATFVNEALADAQASPEAVNRALDLKYGKKRAIFDATDPEANMNLVEEGYTLIKGGQLTGEQWANAKKHDPTLRPSGQIKPTKKVMFCPDGEDRFVPRDQWTTRMHAVVEYTITVCQELLGRPVAVTIFSDITESAGACFGDLGFMFNLGRLGHRFFNACEHGPTDELNQIIIHECGHGMPGGSNHLAAEYHEGLCKIGSRFTRLALKRPELFNWTGRPVGSFHTARKEDGQWIVEGPSLKVPIRFVRGQWQGGVSSEMHARNKAAELNGEPLPFPMELRGEIES